MTTAPTLYQPTEAEIAGVVASAKKRHPALSGRIDKAADILRSGGLELDAAAWDVRQVARWRIAPAMTATGTATGTIASIASPSPFT